MDNTIKQISTKYSCDPYEVLDLLIDNDSNHAYLWLSPENINKKGMNQSIRLILTKEILQELKIQGELFLSGKLEIEILHPIETYGEGFERTFHSLERYKEFSIKYKKYFRIRVYQKSFYNEGPSPSWKDFNSRLFTISTSKISTSKIFVKSDQISEMFNKCKEKYDMSNEEIIYSVYPCLDPEHPDYNEKIALMVQGYTDIVTKKVSGEKGGYEKKFRKWIQSQNHQVKESMITNLVYASSPNNCNNK